LDVPPHDGDAHDAEGGDDAAARQLDQLVAGREALRRRDDGWQEHLPGLGALRAQDLLVLQRRQIGRAPAAGHVVVREAERRVDVLDGLLGRLVGTHERTRKQAMSRIEPTRSSSDAHTASTRDPTFSFGRSSFTTWASAVSAPSSFTRTKAKGVAKGWSPSIGACTTATAVTVPVGFTSIQSPPSAPVVSE